MFVFGLLSVPQFDASRRGKEKLTSFRDKKTKARAMGRMGEEGPLCDPGSELLLGGSARVARG